MDFSCWSNINNERIQNILGGRQQIKSDDESIVLAQTVSLFLCESSRNPSSFLTAPMCLELSEHLFNNPKYINDILSVDSSEKYYKAKKINSTSEEIKKIEEEYKKINKESKAEILKYIMLDYFPMAMEGAVNASREISIEINHQLSTNSVLRHTYDKKSGGLKEAKELLRIENKVINAWHKIESDKDYTKLIRNWYNIDFTLTNTDYIQIDTIGEALAKYGSLV